MNRLAAVLVTALACLLACPRPVTAAAGPVDPGLPELSYEDLGLQPAVDQMVIVDLDRGINLYRHQADVPRSMGITNHLMTAKLALDILEPDTLVTLSLEAAALADNQDKLRAGQRYDLDYLLHALLLENEEAAGYAIAERISDQPGGFVDMMNEQAKRLGMANTLFTQVQGSGAQEQYSTVTDTARLARELLADPTFRTLFSYKEHFYYDAAGVNTYFENDFNIAWTVMNGTTGAAIDISGDASSGVLAVTDRVRGFDYLIVFNHAYNSSSIERNRMLISDLQQVGLAMGLTYEESRLVTAGGTYLRDQQISGVTVDLVFLDTLSYVHPIGDDFIHEQYYRPLDPEPELPILRGQTVGQITFTLNDGTTIVAAVGPSEDIRSQDPQLDAFLATINNNRDLVALILLLAVLLAAASLATAVRQLRRWGYRLNLKRLERERRQLVAEGVPRTRKGRSAAWHRLVSKPRGPSNIPDRIRARYRHHHPDGEEPDWSPDPAQPREDGCTSDDGAAQAQSGSE